MKPLSFRKFLETDISISNVHTDSFLVGADLRRHAKSMLELCNMRSPCNPSKTMSMADFYKSAHGVDEKTVIVQNANADQINPNVNAVLINDWKVFHDGLGGNLDEEEARIIPAGTKIQVFYIDDQLFTQLDGDYEPTRIYEQTFDANFDMQDDPCWFEIINRYELAQHPYDVYFKMIVSSGKLYESYEHYLIHVIQELGSPYIYDLDDYERESREALAEKMQKMVSGRKFAQVLASTANPNVDNLVDDIVAALKKYLRNLVTLAKNTSHEEEK